MFESVDDKAASPIQVPEPALQCISVGAESSEAKTQRPLQLAGEGVGGEGVGEEMLIIKSYVKHTFAPSLVDNETIEHSFREVVTNMSSQACCVSNDDASHQLNRTISTSERKGFLLLFFLYLYYSSSFLLGWAKQLGAFDLHNLGRDVIFLLLGCVTYYWHSVWVTNDGEHSPVSRQV